MHGSRYTRPQMSIKVSTSDPLHQNYVVSSILYDCLHGWVIQGVVAEQAQQNQDAADNFEVAITKANGHIMAVLFRSARKIFWEIATVRPYARRRAASDIVFPDLTTWLHSDRARIFVERAAQGRLFNIWHRTENCSWKRSFARNAVFFEEETSWKDQPM